MLSCYIYLITFSSASYFTCPSNENLLFSAGIWLYKYPLSNIPFCSCFHIAPKIMEVRLRTRHGPVAVSCSTLVKLRILKVEGFFDHLSDSISRRNDVVTRNFQVFNLEVVPGLNIGSAPSVLTGYVWCVSVSSGTFLTNT
jgi:hypothetical protein